MVHLVKVIYEQPSVENTVLSSTYQSSTPEQFSLEENLVLYGGGRNIGIQFITKVHFNSDLQELNNSVNPLFDCELFVLNSSFIIWFTSINRGVEIPYQLIILHAIHTHNKQSKIMLQFNPNDYILLAEHDNSDYESPIEIQISIPQSVSPKTTTNEQLFKGQTTITQLYNAISQCSALHFDTDDDDDDINDFNVETGLSFNIPSIGGENDTENGQNDFFLKIDGGDADELDDYDISEPGVAGIAVDVGQIPVIGIVRNRELDDGNDNDRDFVKLRKLE